MFYDNFTNNQKAVFLDLVGKLINADGVITDFEKDKIENITESFSSISPIHVDNDKLIEIFVSRSERIGLFVELMAISVEDENESKENTKFLKDIAKSLELSEYDLGWIEMWVSHFIDLMSLYIDFTNE